MKRLLYLVCSILIAFALVQAIHTKNVQVADKKASVPQIAPTTLNDVYDREVYNWLRTFSEALNVIKTKYYAKDLDPKEALIKAINAFVSLDPHTTFLDPKTYKEVIESTSGEFFGTGVIIAPKGNEDEFLAIIDTMPEGPADKAGIKSGDKIIEIEGHALRGMTTEEVTNKLKGPRHSKVSIKIVRENSTEPIPFTIIRDVVKDQNSLCYYFKDYQIYYLHLNLFTQLAAKQLEQLLTKSQKQPYKGLILDLRNNSGGLVNSAVDIAGLFLDKGSTVCVTKDRNNEVMEKYVTNRNPISSNGLPIFILMNNFTASAAEILAGCLKIHSEKLAALHPDKKQAKLLVFLVGTTTFGKGSVQEVIPVSNDCAIKTTIALYFLPDDTTIQAIGIKPDIEIERKFPPPSQLQWINQFYGRESALKNHIKAPGSTSEKSDKKSSTQPNKAEAKNEREKSWKERKREMITSDSQIRDTITCINILDANKQSWKNRTDALALLRKMFVGNEPFALEEVEI